MVISIIVRCAKMGFPALHNGELATWGFSSMSARRARRGALLPCTALAGSSPLP
jgi:hypothetical protein